MNITIENLQLRITLSKFRTKGFPEYFCSFVLTLPSYSELQKLLKILRLNIKLNNSHQEYFTCISDTFSYSYDAAHEGAQRSIQKELHVEVSKSSDNIFILTLTRREYFLANLEQHILENSKEKIRLLLNRTKYLSVANGIIAKIDFAPGNICENLDYGKIVQKTLVTSTHETNITLFYALVNNILAGNLLNSSYIHWRSVHPSLPAVVPVDKKITRTTDTPISAFPDRLSDRPLPFLISRQPSFITNDSPETFGVRTSSSDGLTCQTGLLSPPDPLSPAPSTPYSPAPRRRVTLAAMADNQKGATSAGHRRCSFFAIPGK